MAFPWDWRDAFHQKPLIPVNISIARADSCWLNCAEGPLGHSTVCAACHCLCWSVGTVSSSLVSAAAKNRLKLWINFHVCSLSGDMEIASKRSGGRNPDRFQQECPAEPQWQSSFRGYYQSSKAKEPFFLISHIHKFLPPLPQRFCHMPIWTKWLDYSCGRVLLSRGSA